MAVAHIGLQNDDTQPGGGAAYFFVEFYLYHGSLFFQKPKGLKCKIMQQIPIMQPPDSVKHYGKGYFALCAGDVHGLDVGSGTRAGEERPVLC